MYECRAELATLEIARERYVLHKVADKERKEKRSGEHLLKRGCLAPEHGEEGERVHGEYEEAWC